MKFLPASACAVSLMLVVSTGTARAAFIEATDPAFGLGSVTIDTTTGLEWLDLNLTAGRSFVDVAGELGPDGDFRGYRFASRAEILDLFDAFGLPGNTDVFFALLGATGSQGAFPEAFGWGADALTAPWNIYGLDFVFAPGPSYELYRGDALWQNPAFVFAPTGSFLVAVPEPATGLLLALGAVGVLARKRMAT